MYTFEPWRLTPEGAAIHPGERTAVIADVHLGYEWARGSAGDCVPTHSLDETLARLDRLLARAPIARLIVAGDLVESPRPVSPDRRRPAPAPRLARLVRREPHGARREPRSEPPGRVPVDTGFDRGLPTSRVLHGRWVDDRTRPSADGWGSDDLGTSAPGGPRLRGWARRASWPARAGSSCRRSHPTPRDSTSSRRGVPREWLDVPLRCIVSTGEELLDFGPLPELRRRLRRSAT